MNSSAVVSPCVGVCRLDEQRVCIGCYRNIEEIVAWGQLGDEEKRRILLEVAERERAAAR